MTAGPEVSPATKHIGGFLAGGSQRGFLVTGNEIYLAPLETAKEEAERGLQNLKELMGRGAAGPAKAASRISQAPGGMGCMPGRCDSAGSAQRR